jgi:hypothetical protein
MAARTGCSQRTIKIRVQAAEMRFLRSLLGVTGQYRLSIEAIRETIYTSASLGGNKITSSESFP